MHDKQIQAAADVDALSDVAGTVQSLSVEDDGDERQGDVSDTVEEEADPSVVVYHTMFYLEHGCYLRQGSYVSADVYC